MQCLCALFGVSKQAYYKYNEEGAMKKAAKEAFVLEYIRSVRAKCPGIGGKKLWFMYKRDFPYADRVGRDKFEEIIDRHGLKVRKKRRKPRTTDSSHGMRTFPNLVRSFLPTAPNQLWVSDITYITLWKGETGYRFAYLSLVTDAYSHEIIGWALGPNLSAVYPIRALRMAKRRLAGMKEEERQHLIHHSDRGVQYASSDYVKELEGEGIRISMTGSGDPKENAQAERVNNTVKNELLAGLRLTDMKEANLAISKGIEFYNKERPHMSNDMLTPAQAAQCRGELKKWWRSYRDEAIKANEVA